jgi:hypothetical protein
MCFQAFADSFHRNGQVGAVSMTKNPTAPVAHSGNYLRKACTGCASLYVPDFVSVNNREASPQIGPYRFARSGMGIVRPFRT